MSSTDDVLEELALVTDTCTLCGLCKERTHAVFGRGSAKARLMVVGEAPGAEEDAVGLPFVGPSGDLLTKMLKASGIALEDVYICNAVKCRPPGNRPPTEEEVDACNGYLMAQIDFIDPAIILVLGRTAMRALGGPFPDRWRGRWFYVKNIPALTTYHPSFVLRKPSAKDAVGKDLRQLANEYKKRVTALLS